LKKVLFTTILSFLLFLTYTNASSKIVPPPWSPFPLESYNDYKDYFDIDDTSLSYDLNKTKHTINVRGQYWQFRYPTETKESHKQARIDIEDALAKKGLKPLYRDKDRTLYMESNESVRRYYDFSYAWNSEVRIYIYQEHLLQPNQPQEIVLDEGEGIPKKLSYLSNFDGKHYYYLSVEILEGEGIKIKAKPDLEDEAIRIRYSSSLTCDAKYYKRYTMYDLDPYRALHYFDIAPYNGRTKVRLKLLRTAYPVPSLGALSQKAGLLRMQNALSSLPHIESVGNVLGDFNNKGDYLPNGDAIYWLNNAYYTLTKGNLRSNLVPILANHQTTIEWPLYYEEMSRKRSSGSDRVTTKMTIYDVTPQESEQASVTLSLSHLPKDMNLTKEDFSVLEAGTVAGEVVNLEPLHQPMNVVILLDSSGSMKKSMKLALQSVKAFIEKLPEDAKITLVDFDTKVKPITAKNRKMLLAKLKKIKANGATALYDSIIKGVELLKEKSHASIVLFTDGKDANYNDTRRGSKATFEQMMSKVQSSYIPIYPIAFGKGADTTTLTTIAKLTKTTYYQGEKEEQLTHIFDDIAHTLSSAYRLTYKRGKLPREGSQSVVNYMVDVSGSQDLRFTMAKECEGCGYRYEQIKSTLAQSIQNLPENSFVQLSVFNSEVKTLQIATKDRARLLAGIGAMKIGGGTNILEAVKQGYALSSVIPSNRRYFIFLTDAAGDAFKFNKEQQKELKSALLAFKRSGIQTLWLGIVESKKAKKEVERLAKISGGEAFVSADIEKIRQKILDVTQRVGEHNATQIGAGVVTVKLKRRNDKNGQMLVAVGEKAVDFLLLKESNATKKVTDVSYRIEPFDADRESYNVQNAKKIYGDDTPIKEVWLSKILPLRDEHNRTVGGRNRAVKIEAKSAYLFDRLKDIRAGHSKRFLVLDLSLKNLLPSQKVLVLEDGSKHPSAWIDRSSENDKSIEAVPSYIIPDLRRHLFVRVNNEYEIPFESITWALEKPLVELDEHQLVVEPKVKKEGVLAFTIPDEPIKSLSLHLYDTAYGHLDIPLIGTMKVTKEKTDELPKSSFKKMGENFALKVTSESLQEKIRTTKAEKEAVFDILDVTLKSNVNALLKIDAGKRIFLKIKSAKGDYIFPTHPITTALPMGLYKDIALAPGSFNRFKLAFHIPKALKENPRSLLVELKGDDVEIPIKEANITSESKTLTSAKAEGVSMDLNGLYLTPRGYLALDITLHDIKDGESTRVHDAVVMSKYDQIKSFATIVDKSVEYKAGHKGLGSFSNQSGIEGAYKWWAPDSETGQKIVGYDNSEVIYDGTSRRFVVLFDKEKIEKAEANYLISPIFKELSYKIDMKKLPKLPSSLTYLMTEKLAFDTEGDYDKEVAVLLKKMRSKKTAVKKKTGSKLPVVTLDSPDPQAQTVDPLPISLYGKEKLAKIDSIDTMIKTLQALQWVPSLDNGVRYSTASMLTQGWGGEYEMLQALYRLIRTYNVPITLGYYSLSDAGKEALKAKAGAIPVKLNNVPFIEWGEKNHTQSLVLPFLKPVEALSKELEPDSRSGMNGIGSDDAEIKIELTYQDARESVSHQMGGMAGALSGGNTQKEKRKKILNRSFSLEYASDMPIDVWFTEGKNKDGKHIIQTHYLAHDGIENDDTEVEGKIIPKTLVIKLYNGEEYLEEYTFTFKKGQRIDELFFTFAFASPDLSETALKAIETQRKARFSGIKKVAPFSKLQWVNRTKLYRFTALQSRYEAQLQKILGVDAKRNKTPRAMIAMIEKRPDKKLISSLNLRMVFNDVYGDENATRSFNIMSGFFNSKAEAASIPGGKGILEYWQDSKVRDITLLPAYRSISDPAKESITQWLTQQHFSKKVIQRYQESDNYWLIPEKPIAQMGWLEMDPDNYHLISVFENGQHGAMTEKSIMDFIQAVNQYAVGFFIGSSTSIFSVAKMALNEEDYCSILKNAEQIASQIACGVSVLQVGSSMAKSASEEVGSNVLTDNATGGAGAILGCTDHGNAANGIRFGEAFQKMLAHKNLGDIASTVGGYANGFGDAVSAYFGAAKEGASGCN